MTVVLILSMLLVSGGAAWGQVPPQRDADPRPTYGSASISGVVVTDEADPRPVRRAIVTLSGAGLQPSRGAITDDDGRFAIGNLPAGRFTLTAMKASYVSSIYGARRPGRPGTAVVVTDGEQVRDLSIRLWRGAVVTGVVRDPDGRALPGVRVTAIPARPSGDGPLTLTNNASAETNDRGEFRVFGLAPGTYAIAALPGSSGASATLARSEAQVDAILASLRSGAAGLTAASARAPEPTPEPAMPFTYAPVYYPGTPAIGDALPVTLEAGQEAAGLDFTLVRIPTAVVSGVLTRPDGQPAVGAEVQLEPIEEPAAFEPAERAPIEVSTVAGSRFEFAAVPPGTYRLIARASLDPPPPSSRLGGFVTPGIQGTALWAETDLSIAGSDVTGLALALQMPLTITGTIRFAGAELQPPENLGQYRVGLILPQLLNLRRSVTVHSIAFARPVPVAADGSFAIPNVMPGRYGLVVMGPNLGPEGWWARSAVVEGRDWLDGLVEVTPAGPPSGLVVTMSDRHTELSGTLRTAGGAAASDVFVIAYAVDSGYWGGFSRRVKAARPDVAGRYAIADLPPGDYFLAAVTDIDENDWQDPAFLRQLVPASIRIAIAEGATTVQDLMIGGG